jgi:dihydroneopterin aldolase
MSGALPGWISIRGLRCDGRQGVTAEQRAQTAEYLVDVSCHADLGRAVALDDLAAAVDISAIAATVRREMAARPRALVERITADVARALLDSFAAIDEVRVRVEKPRPDGLDAEAESVEIALTRDNSVRDLRQSGT